MKPHDAWLRRFRHGTGARARLVCLPHAGGSASVFRRWLDHLPDDIDLLAVQYPGREDRYTEAFATDIAPLADTLAEAIAPYTDRPLYLFGHSMGASIAYELALRMERKGMAPAGVFASAHPPPHRQRESALHLEDDDGLIADVRRMAGPSPTLLDDPEVRALFLPMLRADYRLIETYRRPIAVALATPIEVLLPVDDGEITRDEALAWQDLTLQPLTLHEVDGGHFYLQRQPEALMARLLPRLRTR